MALIDAQPQSSRQLAAVSVLLAGPANIFNQLYNQWDHQFRLIWEAEDPQAILDALGSNAVELFMLSAGLVTFLETLKPGCTAQTLSLMLPCNYNQDGTVTIQTPPEEPELEEEAPL